MAPPTKKSQPNPPTPTDQPLSFLGDDPDASIASIALGQVATDPQSSSEPDPYARFSPEQQESHRQLTVVPSLSAVTPTREHTAMFAGHPEQVNPEHLERIARTIPETVPDHVRALYQGHELARPQPRPDADPLDVELLDLLERLFHGHMIGSYDAWCGVRDAIPRLRSRVCQPPTDNPTPSSPKS